MVQRATYIDSHGHIMSEDPVEWSHRLVDVMARRGVGAASLSGIALFSPHEDENVLNAHAAHPRHFFPFLCNFDPNNPASLEYVRHQLANYPWAGIGELYLDTGESTHMKLRRRDGRLVRHRYPVAEDGIDNPVLNSLCELAIERQVLLFVHCETPETLSALATRHETLQILAAHLDYHWAPADAQRVLEQHPNVWADIGPVLKHAFLTSEPASWAAALVAGWRAVLRALPHRVCLGTDFFSWHDLEPQDHDRYYEAFEHLLSGLDEDSKQLVRRDNFLRLLGGRPDHRLRVDEVPR